MKIENLKPEDKGRRVFYDRNNPNNIQYGVISSWSSRLVFVRYDKTGVVEATHPSNLEFYNE